MKRLLALTIALLCILCCCKGKTTKLPAVTSKGAAVIDTTYFYAPLQLESKAIQADLNGDGIIEHIQLSNKSVKITSNDFDYITAPVSDGDYSLIAYICKFKTDDAYSELLLCSSLGLIQAVRFDGRSLLYSNKLSASLTKITQGRMILNLNCNILGATTLVAPGTLNVNDDMSITLKLLDGFYGFSKILSRFEEDAENVPRTKEKLTAFVENENGEFVETDLDAGTALVPSKTNLSDTLFFTLIEGKSGYFNCSFSDDGELLLNGKTESELFS